jgi:hypothetical protein
MARSSSPLWHSRSVKKPAEPLVRVFLESGRSFECALNHRVLTVSGYAFVGSILASVPCLPASDWGCGPSARAAGAPSSSETPGGLTGRCSPGSRPCGGLLRRALARARSWLRRSAGALRHSPPSLRSGDPEPKRTNSDQLYIDRLSNPGVRVLSAVRSVAFLSLAACKSAPRTTPTRRVFRPLASAAVVLLRSVAGASVGSGEGERAFIGVAWVVWHNARPDCSV